MTAQTESQSTTPLLVNEQRRRPVLTSHRRELRAQRLEDGFPAVAGPPKTEIPGYCNHDPSEHFRNGMCVACGYHTLQACREGGKRSGAARRAKNAQKRSTALKLRHKKGWAMSKIAAKLKVSKSTVWNWLHLGSPYKSQDSEPGSKTQLKRSANYSKGILVNGNVVPRPPGTTRRVMEILAEERTTQLVAERFCSQSSPGVEESFGRGVKCRCCSKERWNPQATASRLAAYLHAMPEASRERCQSVGRTWLKDIEDAIIAAGLDPMRHIYNTVCSALFPPEMNKAPPSGGGRR